MRRGNDGIWRTVGGVPVSKRQQAELDGVEITPPHKNLVRKQSEAKTKPQTDEPIHKLWIVNSKYPPSPMQEVNCRIVITEKISWAEPIMPLRGTLRNQKRFMLGAFAFYTRSQAEKKKVLLLMQGMKAGFRQSILSEECRKQIEHHKVTGEVK